MTDLLRVSYAAAAWAFWSFVVATGGPRHDSYAYARFRQHLLRDLVRRWIKEERGE